jgi:SAM-dependent methyltransferase
MFLTREAVPVGQNFVFRSQRDAEAIARGDLRFAVCPACGFVFNAAFDPALVAYGGAYENDQSCSPSFSAYADELVRDLVERRGVRGKRVVEVGCGQGYFLQRLVSYPGSENSGVGFDPTYRGSETALDGRVRFERRYYDAEAADTPADAVVCRHVIEHVREPLALLEQVAAALRNAENPRLFFETPSVEWIFRNDAFWDFFYEHCSLFSPASLAFAFERAGFRVEEIRELFGGQYLWIEGDRAAIAPFARDVRELVALALRFGERERALQMKWTAAIDELRDAGPVALWGAGAKGVTFANLIDPSRERIDCVVDLNPAKQETFVAGSGHPIVDYPELATRGVKSAVVMNPNYAQENERLLAAASVDVRLVVAT